MESLTFRSNWIWREAFIGFRGRSILEKERPPLFVRIERGGQGVIHLLANVEQKTIEPLSKDTLDAGTLVYTDEYSIYVRLKRRGDTHKSVNHRRIEYARDENGDGFCEVHIKTMEGWLRPHRGISQETLPLYLFFSSSFTRCEDEVRRCWARSLIYLFQKTPEYNKSVNLIKRGSLLKKLVKLPKNAFRWQISRRQPIVGQWTT